MKKGKCYENAYKYISKSSEEGLMLVHGFVGKTGVGNGRFGHAWVETPDGYVIDASLSLRDPIKTSVNSYYEVNHIKKNETTRYTFMEAMRIAIKQGGHFGPFEKKYLTVIA